MVTGKNSKIIIAILIVISIFLLWLDNYITKTEGLLYQRLESNLIQEMHEVAMNLDRMIKEATKERTGESLQEWFKDAPEVRNELEQQFSVVITSKVKYLYLVYRDPKGRFRFLLDGSKEDKAHFNQKLDVDTKTYQEIYRIKQDRAITQHELERLSITYLYPLLCNDEVEAVLVFDFSSNLTYEMQEVIAPVKTIFMLIYTLIGVFLLITAIQTFYYYQARKKSFVDELTGTLNRQFLRIFLERNSIANYQILMIDFDHFKKINDNYGHDVGDEVLIHGTGVISRTLRPEDFIFRYGGEEFLVLIRNSDPDVAEVIAERIRKSVEQSSFTRDSIDLHNTVSIGVNPIPTHSRNTGEAIKIADMMLYQAKIRGRNCVVSYNDKTQLQIEEKHSIRDTIHQVKSAIDEDRIICHFHKAVDTGMNLHRYEALVRVIDEEAKLVYPNHFLPAIQHTKVYLDLSKRVIDICIATVREKGVAVSMNFAVNDLLNDELMEYFEEQLQLLENCTSCFNIEILENQEIDNIAALKSVINRFRELGVTFAIDDFGSGYANFNYLVELNIDYLKIDGSLVQNVHMENSRNIVKAIILMAKDMGIKTIAEFVSSEKILSEMVALEVDYMQGYHISLPEPIE